jgi:hypothetical protein
MKAVHGTGPRSAEVLAGILEREEVEVNALAVHDLLEGQDLPRLEDCGTRGPGLQDAVEPQVTGVRANRRGIWPGDAPSRIGSDAIFFDREFHQAANGAGAAMLLELPPKERQLALGELQVKLHRTSQRAPCYSCLRSGAWAAMCSSRETNTAPRATMLDVSTNSRSLQGS